MQLIDRFGPRRLVQAVDVLGDDRFQPALAFELGQPQVGRIGPCPFHDELIAVKTVKFLWILFPEGVAQDGFGRIIVFLMIQPVHAPEVRDAALRGDARTAEEDDAVALLDDLFQRRNHNKKRPFPADLVTRPV